MKDLDVILEKHGLPTWGSEDVKKERLKRNNLWPWDAPKKPADKLTQEASATITAKMVKDPEFKQAVAKEVEDDPKMAAALEALKTPSNETYKSAFPSAKKLGRPAKVK